VSKLQAFVEGPRPRRRSVTPRDADAWESSADKAHDVDASADGLLAYDLRALLEQRFKSRAALLCRGDVPVFCQGHLGQLHAPRGLGKTWLLLTWALVVSSGVEALGFRAPERRRVLVIDGEMAAEELQQRLRLLCEVLHVVPDENLVLLAADWQRSYLPRLDTADGQDAVEPFVSRADMVILDNRSCLFDPEGEKDPTSWQPAQDWLLSLRRRGKGVLLAHHANRAGGARGHSKPEDAMNLLLKLSRPEGYVQDQGARFLLEFEKARGVHGPAAAALVGSLTSEGWNVEGAEREEDAVTRKLINHLLVTEKLAERPKSASATVRGAGVNRQAGLRAMADLLQRGRVVHGPDGLKVAGGPAVA
jgi:putative DNA primase/helicase